MAFDAGIIHSLKRLFKLENIPGCKSDQRSARRVLVVSSEVQGQPFGQALIWTIFWISLAGVFALMIFLSMGYNKTLEFISAYAIEKGLSVDNMFVFLFIFSSLGIPHNYQHKILMTGILGAISMRIVLIIAGVTLLESFHWMAYIFGALLVFSGLKMLLQKKGKVMDMEKSFVLKIMKKFVPISFVLNGSRLFSRINGDLYATPMFVSLIIIEMTDLVFALDSIPAVLSITTNSFIVITSNIFAILGLRSMYLLLGSMMNRFYYLKHGLAAILFFVGLKMLFSESFAIPIILSIGIIFTILSVTIILSFIKTRKPNYT
ncbi:MAG: TerC/Alx family metal homeostasis membrane protein [Candidatus Nitrosopolaris sp.]